MVWLGSVATCVLISYVIASAIPVFDALVGLVGAIFGTLMCLQPMVSTLSMREADAKGCMWLYDNWHRRKTDNIWSFKLGCVWSVFVIVAGFFFMGAGAYGSVLDIINTVNGGGATSPWSCADNST